MAEAENCSGGGGGLLVEMTAGGEGSVSGCGGRHPGANSGANSPLWPTPVRPGWCGCGKVLRRGEESCGEVGLNSGLSGFFMVGEDMSADRKLAKRGSTRQLAQRFTLSDNG